MTVKAHTRREFLRRAAALGATALSGLSAFATPGTAAPAADRARLIPYGSAVRAGALATDTTYRQAIVANCDIIVPEGEMKWPDVHPQRNRFDFEKADVLVDFARQHKIEIRGHTLAWYGGMPDWTNEIAKSRRGRSGTGRPYRDRGVALSRRHSLLGRRQRAADRLAGGRQFFAAVDLDQAAWPRLHPDRPEDHRAGRSRNAAGAERIRRRVQGRSLCRAAQGADPVAAPAPRP